VKRDNVTQWVRPGDCPIPIRRGEPPNLKRTCVHTQEGVYEARSSEWVGRVTEPRKE